MLDAIGVRARTHSVLTLPRVCRRDPKRPTFRALVDEREPTKNQCTLLAHTTAVPVRVQTNKKLNMLRIFFNTCAKCQHTKQPKHGGLSVCPSLVTFWCTIERGFRSKGIGSMTGPRFCIYDTVHGGRSDVGAGWSCLSVERASPTSSNNRPNTTKNGKRTSAKSDL